MPFDDGLWLAQTAPERRKRRRHRLRDIEVSEVSLVDRAANKRRFLLAKRGDEMKTKRKATKKADTGLGLIDIDGDTDFGSDTDGAKSDVAKGDAIPAPVKTSVQRALTEATERLMTVVQAVRRAEESTDRAPRPLPSSIGKEIMAVGAVLQGVLRSYPSPVESEDEKEKDDKDEKDDTEKGLSKSARAAVLDTLKAVNERILALHKDLKQEDEDSDDEETEDEEKSDDSEKDDEEKDKDADGNEKQDDDEDEDEEKTDTEKSAAIAKELHGLSLLLGGALARVPTAKAVALVEIDVPADTIEKDSDGLVLHPKVKKALSSVLEDALDNLSGSLRDLNRMPTAKSDEVPDGYELPAKVVDGAAKAGDALLATGLEYGAVATGEAHDLDKTLADAKQAAEDAKAPPGHEDDDEEADDEDKKDDVDKKKAKKAKKGEPDIAETIKDAVAAAMVPVTARLDQIETGVKKNAKTVKKAIGAKSAGNAVPAGTKVEKKSDADEGADGGGNLNGMTPDKVKQLKKDGLWF